MSDAIYDVVIIGAGPAGIQAAIHSTRKKTNVLMLGRFENSAIYPAHVENYACIDGVTDGEALLEAGRKQLERFGTEMRPDDVLKIAQEEDGHFTLELESGDSVTSRTLIFAMGVSKNKLAVPGEKELGGCGVSYCVDCDANFYRGDTVMVVGNQSAAIDGALTLLDYAAKVYLVAEELQGSEAMLEKLSNSAVELHTGEWVQEIIGQGKVEEILLKSGNKLKVEGVFIELGSKGALELATQVGVMLDTEQFKYIDVNRKQETNIPGIYAAGDIVGPPYQMAKAVGEGCVAGMEAAMFARKKRQ
ncbi:MAG: NAD(P)/FAD-dependent oxidoreductase [Candidatus Electrothrix aestuarii]|uniref:NAD(P)/FAD-dependent oxidoreductase n=1 Tax=Candidatus Electrothrix aestuarii TaxID=3062594 RepID=A0AAU8LQH5_9BACT|nr:NAD(P)/FAD-dependent oxidoreductase [Candidatus Electrothrix aestuarii]